MSTLRRLRRATRDDLVPIGEASRPPLPGAAPKLSAEKVKLAQVERLDRNGPKQMSDEGYARAQTLLKAAQARPAGSAKRIRKDRKRADKAKDWEPSRLKEMK